MPEDLKSIEIGENVSLYRVVRVVYDKDENTQDKLTTVYSTIFSLANYGLLMLVNGHKDCVEVYVGVVSRNMVTQTDENGNFRLYAVEKDLVNSGKVLKNAFLGNFPGTELQPVNPVTSKNVLGKRDVIEESFKTAKYISAVSSIPAIRNSNESKNREFVQGLEKLIDTLKGKEYTALIIADAMSNEKVEAMCAEYEDILTGKKNGSCIVCKQETDWNEATQKYERFCKNPECKAKYREMSEGNKDIDVGGNAGINCSAKIKSTNG